MKSGRRSNIEIIADILRIGGSSKTNILYQCDLSYPQIQRYLSFLVSRGLMTAEDSKAQLKTYRPTIEGEQLLIHIDRVRQLLDMTDHDAAAGEDFPPVAASRNSRWS